MGHPWVWFLVSWQYFVRQKSLLLTSPTQPFQNGQSPASFSFIFCLFKQATQFLQIINNHSINLQITSLFQIQTEKLKKKNGKILVFLIVWEILNILFDSIICGIPVLIYSNLGGKMEVSMNFPSKVNIRKKFITYLF